MEKNTSGVFEELQIDPASHAYLREIARWARFLAISGFVFSGLLIVIGVASGVLFASVLGDLNTQNTATGVSMVIGYVFLAVMNFFPFFFLNKFAVRMQAALQNSEQHNLSVAFSNLKICFQIVGILTIISLVGVGFMIVALLIGLGAAGLAS
jgi:Zn-dependent protease with chaperone function